LGDMKVNDALVPVTPVCGLNDGLVVTSVAPVGEQTYGEAFVPAPDRTPW